MFSKSSIKLVASAIKYRRQMPETTVGCDKDKLKVMTHVIREAISIDLKKKLSDGSMT